MRSSDGLQGLRRVQRPLAAILLAFFLLQLPLTGLLAGRHVSEMALAALFGDSICRPDQTGDTPGQPKAPPGHSDCCLAGCVNPAGALAALPSPGLTLLPTSAPVAITPPAWREQIAPPARFASDISSRGPPLSAA